MRREDLIAFRVHCNEAGVAVPSAVDRAIELIEVAIAHDSAPAGPVLGLSDDELRERITAVSIRRHTGRNMLDDSTGMNPGIQRVRDQILTEVRGAVLPDLDGIIETLRPKFDEHAAHLELGAQEYGFTSTTSSDAVIDLDAVAIDAFRSLRPALAGIEQVARFRRSISRIFETDPTPDTVRTLYVRRGIYAAPQFDASNLNYSVLFAAGDNWSYEDGFHLERETSRNRPGQLDWLALAAGGLRLNTIAEVQTKLEHRHDHIPVDLPKPPEQGSYRTIEFDDNDDDD